MVNKVYGQPLPPLRSQTGPQNKIHLLDNAQVALDMVKKAGIVLHFIKPHRLLLVCHQFLTVKIWLSNTQK